MSQKIFKNNYFILISVLVSALIILFLRRPTFLTNPQFWAEDGKFWFANAYNFGGFKAMLLSQDGYFQTFSRLVAAFSLNFSVTYTPLVFNLAVLIVQILPVWFLFTERCKKLIPSFKIKIIIALIYLLIPNSAEIRGSLTYSQWLLALLSFLIIVVQPSPKIWWKIFDYFVLIVSALSGPYVLFLTIVCFINYLKRKTKDALYKFLVLALGSIVQLYALLFLSNSSRIQTAENFSIILAVKIFASQIILGSLIGYNGNVFVIKNFSGPGFLYLPAAIVGIIILGYALYKGPFALRLFILFSAMLALADFIAPTKELYNTADFKVLIREMNGVRYWFIPMLGFLSCLVWGIFQTASRNFKVVSGFLLSLCLIGVISDFKYPALNNLNYPKQIQNFEKQKTGKIYTFPINPSGWTMDLVKK